MNAKQFVLVTMSKTKIHIRKFDQSGKFLTKTSMTRAKSITSIGKAVDLVFDKLTHKKLGMIVVVMSHCKTTKTSFDSGYGTSIFFKEITLEKAKQIIAKSGGTPTK